LEFILKVRYHLYLGNNNCHQ